MNRHDAAPGDAQGMAPETTCGAGQGPAQAPSPSMSSPSARSHGEPVPSHGDPVTSNAEPPLFAASTPPAPRRRLFTLAENLFFGLVMALSFGFALVLLRQARWSWSMLVSLVAFWAVMAYLALPRLHRILTTIYVPDYFIGRSRTTDGLLGDPVNLAFTGDERQLHHAMQEAGWTRAEPVTLASSCRIVAASLLGRSYAAAPVSPLMLFGHTQAFSYQQEVEGSPSQRHHVRFWPTPAGWLLPGGTRVDWLASGTYDTAVGLSLFTWQVTHRIARDIDTERDHVVDTVVEQVPGARVHVLEDFSTGYHSRNGGGDAVQTDGDLPVVELDDVVVPPGAHAVDSGHLSALGGVGRRPFAIVAAMVLTGLSAILSLGDLVLRWQGGPSGTDVLDGLPDVVSSGAWVVLGVVLYLPILWLAWRTFRGGRYSRLAMTALVSLGQGAQMWRYLQGERPPFSALISMTIDLLLVYALTSLSAREWTAGESS